jgi:hypothetical protein
MGGEIVGTVIVDGGGGVRLVGMGGMVGAAVGEVQMSSNLTVGGIVPELKLPCPHDQPSNAPFFTW